MAGDFIYHAELRAHRSELPRDHQDRASLSMPSVARPGQWPCTGPWRSRLGRGRLTSFRYGHVLGCCHLSREGVGPGGKDTLAGCCGREGGCCHGDTETSGCGPGRQGLHMTGTALWGSPAPRAAWSYVSRVSYYTARPGTTSATTRKVGPRACWVKRWIQPSRPEGCPSWAPFYLSRGARA